MGNELEWQRELLPQIKNWRSVKSFAPTEIEDDKILRILEAGRRAPSAKNRQPWRFILVNKESVRERIMNAAYGQPHVGEAPAIICACTTNIDYRMSNGQLSYPIDLSFAASFMLFQAATDGLGACVVTTFDEREVKEIITAPYSMRVVMLLLLGYPLEAPLPVSRKPLSSVISYNHW